MVSPSCDLVPVGPVDLRGPFARLDTELIRLLESLHDEAWLRPTACRLWSVKDVAAHLLDGNVRRLSLQRAGPAPRLEPPPADQRELIAYLNRLNAEWITAAKRISPRLLIELLAFTGPMVIELFRRLDPDATALFSVAWAGESRSANWFDIGREYTERWLHQQQIREAVGAEGLTARPWLHPALDLFMRALPYTYRAVEAPDGTAVLLEIEGEAGGVWTLLRTKDAWRLHSGAAPRPAAAIGLDQDAAWRLFARQLPPEAGSRIRRSGSQDLTSPVLESAGVMA